MRFRSCLVSIIAARTSVPDIHGTVVRLRRTYLPLKASRKREIETTILRYDDKRTRDKILLHLQFKHRQALSSARLAHRDETVSIFFPGIPSICPDQIYQHPDMLWRNPTICNDIACQKTTDVISAFVCHSEADLTSVG